MQEELSDNLSLSDTTALKAMRATIVIARFVQIAICASGHFVLLQARRQDPTMPWELLYQDPLPKEIPGCRAAAQNVAMYLKLLPEGSAVPASEPGFQKDSWSCGLWVLQEQEHQLRRVWREEPVTSKVPLQSILHRLNDFVGRVSPTAKLAMVASKKEPSHIHLLSLQDAFEASVKCTKCKPTMLGHKGCNKCMGPFFKQAKDLRIKDPSENVV